MYGVLSGYFLLWYSYLYPFGDANVGLGGLLGQVYVGDDSSVAACVGASTCTILTYCTDACAHYDMMY